jgi:hypothetical protein
MYVTLLGDAVNKFIAGENQKTTKFSGCSDLEERGEVFKKPCKLSVFKNYLPCCGRVTIPRSPDLSKL